MIFLSLLILFFICSRIAIGFYECCQFEHADEFDKLPTEAKREWKVDEHSKMIFWWVRFYLGRHLNYFWAKPLYSCPICMASVHSVIPVLIFLTWHGYDLIWFFAVWPMTALVVAGMNKNVSMWWDK